MMKCVWLHKQEIELFNFSLENGVAFLNVHSFPSAVKALGQVVIAGID